jgi:hypothetical protein
MNAVRLKTNCKKGARFLVISSGTMGLAYRYDLSTGHYSFNKALGDDAENS